MSAKDLHIKPICVKDAQALVKKIHYSRKVVASSSLHLGVFYKGKLEGAMQFGCPIDKRKVLPLVKDTKWNNFLELNRMAFSDVLPRNSESRALAIAFRLIKKQYPHIEWILSYADGTQCGDGTIYRASGFYLTGIKENKTILKLPSGEIVADKTLNNKVETKHLKKLAKPLAGFQLRYIYFINKKAKDRLTVPILEYSDIAKLGAGMYKGQKRVGSDTGDTLAFQAKKEGSNPIPTLQLY